MSGHPWPIQLACTIVAAYKWPPPAQPHTHTCHFGPRLLRVGWCDIPPSLEASSLGVDRTQLGETLLPLTVMGSIRGLAARGFLHTAEGLVLFSFFFISFVVYFFIAGNTGDCLSEVGWHGSENRFCF